MQAMVVNALIQFSLGPDEFTDEKASSESGVALLTAVCLWKVYHQPGQHSS
jgi:hypothetical protein